MRIHPYIVLFVFSLITSCNMHSDKNYPETLTADKLLSIKLGMNKDTVKTILGEPIFENNETFEYTKRQNYHYPMIWIHFDSDTVREVYVKKYFFFDDQGIYGLSKHPLTGEIHQWGEEALRETIR
jgi:outer membrane protein assembly factor BamE (lipoprotein component of BamABCDE complex)